MAHTQAGYLSPQESHKDHCLGLLHFVSCINDIPRDLSHSSSLALFADDVKCFLATRTVSDCESLQSDILTI